MPLTAASICFLYDTRVRFLVEGRDDGKGSPMACAVVYWGRNKPTFTEVFRKHGAVVDLNNIALPGQDVQPKLKLVADSRRTG